MQQQVRALDSLYQGGVSFTLGNLQGAPTRTFLWTGIDWTPALLLSRATMAAIAFLIALFAAVFFDRFDPARASWLPARNRPTSGATAMLSELSGFMEKLQEVSSVADRLEGENEQLRSEVNRLQDLHRPEAALEAIQLREQVAQLQAQNHAAAAALAQEGARVSAAQAEASQLRADCARLAAEVAEKKMELANTVSAASATQTLLQNRVQAVGEAAKVLHQLAKNLES